MGEFSIPEFFPAFYPPGSLAVSEPSTLFVLVDDKHVPLYRILWVADTPHFCGNEDCNCEGDYEVRLEQDESVWASRQERDNVLAAIESWYNGHAPEGGGGMEEPWEPE
jgi:hypothetical protein